MMRKRLSLQVAFAIVAGIIMSIQTSSVQSQWLDWADETSTRLTVTTVANSDGEEKDMWAADLNNDGWKDLIVVRKQPFSTSTQPGKSNLLLMNINGHMTDQTTLYAPEFITNINFARDVYVGDFDGDNWKDVIIANTFSQQPMYYRNRGNDSTGTWLGLVDESSLRFPVLTDDAPLFCAVWGGDVTGEGYPDIYFTNYKPNSSGGIAQDYLLINNGNGFFTNESQARLGNLRNSAFGTACQIADMDNDGDNDIIKNTTLYSVAPWGARGVIVLFNNGTGNFTTWQNLTPTGSPYMFEVADFNMDGKKDLYVVDDGADYVLRVTAFTPNTSLTFVKTNLSFSTSNGFGGNVHAIDLDLDGDLDIGVADVDVDIPPCNSGRRMAIYRNDNGVFTDVYGTTPQLWGVNSYDFAWIDINNDGLHDLITGLCAGYKVIMNDNCSLAPASADFDLDGLADACDPCPANPDPGCAPPTTYPTVSTDYSVARQWNELLLASIRRDFARPTVHARNLFHISAAMWDAWSAYDLNSKEFLLGQTVRGFNCPFNGIVTNHLPEDRNKAISYAAYRLLKHRFTNSPQAILLNTAYDVHMDSLGYDKTFTSVDYSTGNPAALGNYIAQCYINFGFQDGSNETGGYANTSYAPVNPPMNVDIPGNPNIVNYNRWQPLTLGLFIDQSGNPIPGATPPALSPEWGQVVPFALDSADMVINQRNGFNYNVFHDPGAPPLLQLDGQGTSDQYQYGFALVAAWSSHLTSADSVMWDISPASLGNRDTLPATVADYPNFYNLTDGSTTSPGHSINPKTGLPYAPNIVPRGDYARVLAEFWADGPESETPPGHWYTIFNYVSDHPLQTKQYKGIGTPLDELEWDVKGYLAIGAAMHDVAISVWGMKGWYDYLRPVSAIRAMAALGQSTNTGGPSYHPAGIPLIPGYIEVIALGDPLADGTTNVGKIKMKAWKGHHVINNVDTDEAGVDWILADKWVPYQRPSFVTPPFSGYISGHSTFSRAAAEILTDFTGDKYFPGGLGEFLAPQNQFLVFEDGPSVDVNLQWATYQDAADESSLSRIWGGIHPPCDDIPGRKIAVDVAEDVFTKAEALFFNVPCVSSIGKPGYIQATGGNSKMCPGESKIYTIPALLGATSYEWTAPAGAVITNGQGTNSVTVSYTDDFISSDSLKVAGINACGAGENRTLMILRNNPGTPGALSGEFSLACPNSSFVYSVPSVAGMTYNWTPPAQANILSGQGSASVTVEFSGLFNNGFIEVTAENGCAVSNIRKKKIYSVPLTPGVISGEGYALCGQINVPYSVPLVTGLSYIWTVPAGAIISAGQGTNSILVDFTGSVASGFVKVSAFNVCGSSAQRSKSVSTTTAPPPFIIGDASVCINETGVPYSIPAIAAATSYKWTAPTGSTISDGIVTSTGRTLTTASTSVFVNYGSNTGRLTVVGISACGAGKAKSMTITFNCRSEIPVELINESSYTISAYPNPVSEVITVSGTNVAPGWYTITLTNLIGQDLMVASVQSEGNSFDEPLDLKEYSSGIYFITIRSQKVTETIKIFKE